MSEWAPKRFWKNTEVSEVEGGFTVTLDGRGIKTPAKTAVVVPTNGLAQAIAAEWDAQEEKVDPATMPFMRTTNSAIDKVTIQHAEVADMLAAYADSDLLCYRADHPAELVERQRDTWDPVLDWADKTFGVRLEPRAGVMHAPQSPKALEICAQEVHGMSPYALAAFHDLVTMTGSFILALAACRNAYPAEDIWAMSRLDELWQEEQWGQDDEATQKAEYKRGEFQHAFKYYHLSI